MGARGRWALLTVTVGFVACGGDEDGSTEPPVITAPGVGFTYDADEACAASVPVPNDLFRAANLQLERDCGAPADAIDAAIDAVVRQEGAQPNTAIALPIINGDLAVQTINKQVAWSLTSSVGTSSTATDLPPLVLLQRVGSSTTAAGWQRVEVDAAYAGGTLTVTPRRALDSATYFVLVATNSITDAKGTPLTASPAVSLMVGASPIVAESYPALDAGTAAKLERERGRLAPVVALLAGSNPAITADRIASIQGWTTAVGDRLLERTIDAYRAAVARGRYDFSVTTVGGDLDPMTVFPTGSEFGNVRAVRRGTIRVPKLLDASGRIRPGWDSTAIETTEVPFIITLPRTNRMRYPTTVLLTGYGRGKEDALSLAHEFGGGPQSSVLAIDLPYHGARSTNPADTSPNNGNPVITGADGIPDASGDGFFQGDPGALRDGLIATVLEVVHIVDAIKDGESFEDELINPDRRLTNIHMIAQGHSAMIGLLASVHSPVGTVQLPSGGFGVDDMVIEGPAGLRAAFLASGPAGVNEANLATYFAKLDASILIGLGLPRASQAAYDRYIDGNPVRILAAHPNFPEFVNADARQTMVDMLMLPGDRVSRHLAVCDDFFIYTCQLGQGFEILPRAKAQLAAFASSGGVTVRPPAN